MSLEFSRHLMPDTIALSDRTYGEICGALDIDADRMSRILIAAGLPAPDPERRAREDDVTLLRLVTATLQRQVSEDAVIAVVRVFGQATRRIAETMREFFRDQIEERLVDQGMTTAEMMTASAQHRVPLQTAGLEAIRMLSTRFLEDMVFENITTRIQEVLAAHGLLEPRGAFDPAVAFVDLAGYSVLTREIGEQEVARKINQFEMLAQESVPPAKGRVVKSLGDGLLLFFPEAERAVGGCLDLMGRMALAKLPEAHVGLSAGSVIRRDGDIFGNSVNLAARLAAFAQPSEIAVDGDSLPWLSEQPTDWTPCGKATPKGMPEIDIYKLSACPSARAADTDLRI